MNVALKLINCRVNTRYFAKNHEILSKHFDESEETQAPFKHVFSCTWEDYISYFAEPATLRRSILALSYTGNIP